MALLSSLAIVLFMQGFFLLLLLLLYLYLKHCELIPGQILMMYRLHHFHPDAVNSSKQMLGFLLIHTKLKKKITKKQTLTKKNP